MRIAISGAAGIAAVLFAAAAAAQGDKPQPLPVQPTIPGLQPGPPVVSSGAPPASASAQPVAPPVPPSVPSVPPVPPVRPKAKAAAHPDAPPPPPPPGIGPPPPPPIVGPTFSAGVASQQALKEPPLAGWHGSFFLRDPSDYIRLYPQGRLHLDFHSFPGAPTGDASAGGLGLQPRFFARRLRLELSGQAFQRWTFTFGADFGGQSLPNANGRTEPTSALPGGDPAADPARYVPNEGVSANAVIANAFINYSICPCLNLMVGQHQAPFGLENRTSNNVTSFMERNLPIRGFAFPNGKEMGLTVWGDLLDGRLSYELGVYSGDGQNRPQVDNNPDFIGRIFTRPLVGSKSPIAKLQLGVSGHGGQRDQKLVAYDYPAITTGQGFTLWDPRYRDALGRAVHVIPSGAQNALGGEFRLPLSIFELRGEAYYVSNDTREAIEGYQLLNTERLGQMTGVGWYVQASAWPYGDAFVNGDPGFSRPVTMSLATEVEKPKKGVEIVALVGGVNAEYQGNSRGGAADESTPGRATSSKIDIFQYGLGLNYWYSNHLRVSANYTIYHTPGSGSADNLATVPANLGAAPRSDEHLLHELGTRVAIWF